MFTVIIIVLYSPTFLVLSAAAVDPNMFHMTRQLMRRSRSCPSGDVGVIGVSCMMPLEKGPLHATSDNLDAASAAGDNGEIAQPDSNHRGPASNGCLPGKPVVSAAIHSLPPDNQHNLLLPKITSLLSNRMFSFHCSLIGLRAETSFPSVLQEDDESTLSELAKRLTIQSVRELSTTSKFDRRRSVPAGIHFIQGTENVIVADCSNRKVKVFDLEENLKVECAVRRDYGSLQEPVSACLNKQNHILVADRAGGNVKVFTSEGRLLTSFGRDLVRPRDICSSLDLESVLVVDEKRQDVFLYATYSARCRRKLGEQSQQNIELSSKLSVCSTINHLLVYDAANYKLHVFDNQGNYLRDLALMQCHPGNESISLPKTGAKSLPVCHMWADTVLCLNGNGETVLADTAAPTGGGDIPCTAIASQCPFDPSWQATSNVTGLLATGHGRDDTVTVYEYKL